MRVFAYLLNNESITISTESIHSLMTTAEQESRLNPYPWYQAMRATNPIAYNENYNSWSVFSYDAVQRVLTDYSDFSSQIMGDGSGQPLGTSLINTDPPRHRKLRSIVTQAFTPRTIAQLAPRITEIVNELLDKVAAQGQMDVVVDLAYPLPVIVIAELLGVPVKDREQFKHWSDVIVGSESPTGGEPQKEMTDYFSVLIAERRREPKNDLISSLLTAQVDGEYLNEKELMGFFILLLIAGNVTTTNLIGNSFLCFDEFPEALVQLYADPTLVPAAIEEVLRFRSPVSHMYRVVREDTQLDDKRIAIGSFMVAWIASANRDETQFPHADRFDITRNPNRHLAFGHGIHFCLGAPLARLEAKIALEIMLARLPEMRPTPNTSLEALSSMILFGVKNFPITFKPS